MTVQQVKTLRNGVMQPGYHSVVFESGTLPSGVYIARFSAAGKTFTTKMVLNR
jgi:hypothetical protein